MRLVSKEKQNNNNEPRRPRRGYQKNVLFIY